MLKTKNQCLGIVKKNKVYNVLMVSNKEFNLQMYGILKDREKVARKFVWSRMHDCSNPLWDGVT